MHRNLLTKWTASISLLPLLLFAEESPSELPPGYREINGNKTEAIAELCRATAETGLFSGAVLVADNGEILFQEAFGLANKEWNIPNTIDTKFRLASVSKPFTAMLVLQLVEEGRISLEDSITEYLPDYREDTGDRITIHHLLSHQSGIPDFTANFDYRKTISRLPFDPDEFIELYCSGDLLHEPGTIYSYCNAGYCILGRIIEKVSRNNLETNLVRRIFTPLGMKNSGFDRNRYIVEKRASGYTKGAFEFTNAEYLDMDSSPGAAGSLYSTVGDLYLWDRALYTDEMLSGDYRDLMFTPNRDVPEVKAAGGRAQSRYGYGWNIYTRRHPVTEFRTKIISHGGAISGFRAMLYRLIDEDAFVVILCNQGDAFGKSDVWNAVQRLGGELIHVVTDQPYRLPNKPSPSQEQRIYQLSVTEGADAAIEWFRKRGKQAPWGGSLIEVAEKLIEDGFTEEGLQLLEFECKESPKKVWILRKTAQAFLGNRKPQKALFYASEALQLKPDDDALQTISREAREDMNQENGVESQTESQ